MRVFLDDTEITPPEPTLAACLAAGAEAGERAGRVVVEVWVDGAPAPEADLEHPPGRSPYADEVRLVTAEPCALVRTVMLDVAETLGDTIETQARAADAIQIGRTAEGLQGLGEALRAWDAARRAVDEGCALIRSRGGPDPAPAVDPALVERLGAALASVKEALAREDWALLADLLAYDLKEQAEAWRRELARLADAVQPAP